MLVDGLKSYLSDVSQKVRRTLNCKKWFFSQFFQPGRIPPVLVIKLRQRGLNVNYFFNPLHMFIFSLSLCFFSRYTIFKQPPEPVATFFALFDSSKGICCNLKNPLRHTRVAQRELWKIAS